MPLPTAEERLTKVWIKLSTPHVKQEVALWTMRNLPSSANRIPFIQHEEGDTRSKFSGQHEMAATVESRGVIELETPTNLYPLLMSLRIPECLVLVEQLGNLEDLGVALPLPLLFNVPITVIPISYKPHNAACEAPTHSLLFA